MGARISIHLYDCLEQPNVKVEFYVEPPEQPQGESEAVSPLAQQAVLKFEEPGGIVSKWILDVVVHNRILSLEGDFNFFRDPDRHGKNMRLLFENSIPFKVIPG
jgi:hypothetical protein